MTNTENAPAGQGGGAQVPEKQHISDESNSTKPSPVQALREPFMNKPEPWPERVDGVELLDELVALFRRHVSLPDGAAEALALWVIFSHALNCFDVSPRLAVLSPVPECGKTSVLELLSRLVPMPLPTCNMSAAVVYRVIAAERPTILIDEADTFFGANSEMSGILNSGHTRSTAYVWRCGSPEQKYAPEHFSTWAVIAIALIGKLPPALESRSIIISMQRARPDERLERITRKNFSEIEVLARKAASFVGSNQQTFANAEPPIPAGLNNRTADNWRPLLAIADIAGGEWPAKARTAALTLSGQAEPPLGIELLIDIRHIFAEQNMERLSSGDLCMALGKLADRPWSEINRGYALSRNGLAKLLRPFEIRPRVVRIGEQTPRGYAFAQFEDAFGRYLPSGDTTSFS